ncbi:glycosyltransferase family 61 protein [Ideonella paludis]|uniref:glycosyltransferase family 61 protein n=1 Tax=Ideonella paludis TaxID=1233411 RepID=UPI0036318F50
MLKFYREGTFCSSALDSNRARRAIFINRQNLSSSRRKIANFEDLSRVLISRGVSSVELDGVSVENQAHIFANSSTIVAGHGAGLANLVFAKPGTKLIVFENKINSEFVSLAYWLGLEVYAIPTAQVEYESGGSGKFVNRDCVISMWTVNFFYLVSQA